MPYNSVISRSEAAALIPESASREIVQQIVTDNPVLRLARRLQNMPRGQQRMPVMSALATAYFVSPTDTGLKQTTEVNWAALSAWATCAAISFACCALAIPVPIAFSS